MKRIALISLIFVILAGTVGVELVFISWQSSIRKEIKKRIKNGVPEEDLYTIVFESGKTPDWVKPGKEFRKGDELFDVVTKEQKGDQTIYHCINDVQERTLFSNLGELTNKSLNDEQNPMGKMLRGLFKVYSTDRFEYFELPHLFCEITEDSYFLYNRDLLFNHFETATPPPDFC